MWKYDLLMYKLRIKCLPNKKINKPSDNNIVGDVNAVGVGPYLKQEKKTN